VDLLENGGVIFGEICRIMLVIFGGVINRGQGAGSVPRASAMAHCTVKHNSNVGIVV
jgi:hypothetical protein